MLVYAQPWTHVNQKVFAVFDMWLFALRSLPALSLVHNDEHHHSNNLSFEHSATSRSLCL